MKLKLVLVKVHQTNLVTNKNTSLLGLYGLFFLGYNLTEFSLCSLKFFSTKNTWKCFGWYKKCLYNIWIVPRHFCQSVSNDGVLNSSKNKLDVNEDKEGKVDKKPAFVEPSDIVDCNQQSGHTGRLSTKRYRTSPKESSVQYTMHCNFRNSIKKENGEVFGMYPMLIQPKYRIDDKRPMDKDGKEQKPWSKSTIFNNILEFWKYGNLFD